MITYSGGTAPISKRPGVQRIVCAEINVRLITALEMDQIEMPASLASSLDFDDFARRSIKFRLWKDFFHKDDGACMEKDDHIDVLRGSDLAINHRRD